MLQPNHRGIYEYLWSEHKYVALGVSYKAFNTCASKLGTIRQCLNLLRKLSNLALAEKPELISALLSAYMHVKPHLSRFEREDLIKTLLTEEQRAAELIYEAALKHEETTLYPCRLFFPPERGLYKFWDVQHHPGQWLCFGPFQLHLTHSSVYFKIRKEIGHPELLDAIKALKAGVSNNEYPKWPEHLRQNLENNNMVAIAGTKAWLHPRADFEYSDVSCSPPDFSIEEKAGLVLEKIWDSEEFGKEYFAQLPEETLFNQTFDSISDHFNWQRDEAEAAYDFLNKAFSQIDSTSGIGMETTHEQIDSEEGEHGDYESED